LIEPNPPPPGRVEGRNMNILKTDSYLPAYVLEKKQNPDKKLWWLQVKRKDLEDVDRLVAISHGNRETVKTAQDWMVLEEILKFYISRWPNEFLEFRKTVPQIRATRRTGGYTKDKGIKYVASLPPRFENLIKIIFSLQVFDKTFVYKLINKFKIFKVGGA
jgi:hypothetical protein